MTSRDKRAILANTREMLSMAEGGYAEAIGRNPRRRRPGLMNLITYGRSVTAAIQTMRNTDPAFDSWWTTYQNRFSKDPLMQYFNKTRTEIIHEGTLSTTSSVVIGKEGVVNVGALFRELSRHAPPNAVGTFLGDALGGNGWEVQMPDGTTDKVYFDLPSSVDVSSELHLLDPPTEHDGKPITDTSVANLGSLYLATLRRTIEEFEARFR